MSAEPSRTTADPYRGVVWILLALTSVGSAGALVVAGFAPLTLDAALVLGIAGSVLYGVLRAQEVRRSRPGRRPKNRPKPRPAEERDRPPPTPREALAGLRTVIAVASLVAVLVDLMFDLDGQVGPEGRTRGVAALIAVGVCLAAAGTAGLAARYFGGIDAAQLPEAPALCRGGRTSAWLLVVVAAAVGTAWARLSGVTWALHLVVVGVVAIAGVNMLRSRPGPESDVFVNEVAVLDLLGSRANVIASILDGAQRQLGIDLRSTWALTVVRRYVQPLALGLAVLGWLSTGITIVGPGQNGIVERFGVARAAPLGPGLHVHWPWPVDHVLRIPVVRVRSLTVGHEGEEAGGPENVLWARQHAANEYTLLLGDGHDLITVDAAVQYRIRDVVAWHYQSSNPADALRAIAYRAVMRATVNRTLGDALSENVATLTAQIRDAVQAEADALDLGVDVVAFTIGGMHPPVDVARDYQAVVSAELGKVTAIVGAQAVRNRLIPTAEAAAANDSTTAKAEAATDLARAAGEAWSFRALEAQYHADPAEYRFRRRLEALEQGLAHRRFTIVDARIMRDGGELWLTR
ncbi:MAG TPA: protease modulator HflK [Kofleriaceae bacterium]|nr:protease modulator HflK [Kofleriaceae bacterium]